MLTSARKCQGLIVLFFLVVMLVQTSGADTVDSTVKDMVLVFLSDVVGLDLTKYNITNEGYYSDYPPYYGGEVKEEVLSFDLISSEGSLSVMGIFYNGFIYGLVVYHVSGSMMYSRQPAANAVDESRNILQRYKSFAEDYGFGTSHVDSALTMLNNDTTAPSLNADLHLFNNITGFVPSVTYGSNVKLETTEKRVRWIYTDSGVDMPNKCLSISFGKDEMAFTDKWNLFKVGSLSVISEEEAKSIGWEAAQNYNLTLVDEKGDLFSVTPKWSNVSTIALNMIPGQIYNRDPEDNFITGGNATRDPLALYPQWQMLFHFESIGGTCAIQVGVWGDTKEIAYISATGYLGAPEVPDTATEPSATQSENPPQTENSNPPTNMYLIAGIVAVITITIAVAAVVLMKRRK